MADCLTYVSTGRRWTLFVAVVGMPDGWKWSAIAQPHGGLGPEPLPLVDLGVCRSRRWAAVRGFLAVWRMRLIGR